MTGSPEPAARIGAIVLAGGRARRFGGQDKGLICLRGRPLAAWVLDRLRGRVAEVVLSANRHLAEYAALGWPVVSDRIPDHAGPLAGIHAAAAGLASEWVLTAPCDTPFLPLDLVPRLLTAVQARASLAVYAAEDDQPHYGVMLFNRTLLDPLADFLQSGGRRAGAWLQAVGASPVIWTGGGEAFFNVNTPADLARADVLAERLAQSI